MRRATGSTSCRSVQFSSVNMLCTSLHHLMDYNWVPLLQQTASVMQRLEVKGEYYQNCSVLCCVWQLCTSVCAKMWAVINLCLVTVRLVFSVFIKLQFVLFVCFCGVFSVLSQKIGWEDHLRNDLFCVEWDVKTLLDPPIHDYKWFMLHHNSCAWRYSVCWGAVLMKTSTNDVARQSSCGVWFNDTLHRALTDFNQ